MGRIQQVNDKSGSGYDTGYILHSDKKDNLKCPCGKFCMSGYYCQIYRRMFCCVEHVREYCASHLEHIDFRIIEVMQKDDDHSKNEGENEK